MTREEKVEAVKQMLPDYQTINPYNWSELDRVRRTLCGTVIKQKITEVSDSILINLVRRAQGKMPARVCVASRPNGRPKNG